MHERFMKRIEFVANIGIIVVAILGCIVLVRYLVSGARTVPEGARSATTSAQTGIGLTGPLAVGMRITLQGVDWKQHEKTVVFVLSTKCHYCTDSAPFYRRLLTEMRKRGVGRASVAVVAQNPDEATRYLSGLGVSVDAIVHAPPTSVGLHGTPALLLVDNRGVVKRAWLGRLPPDKENEVVGSL